MYTFHSQVKTTDIRPHTHNVDTHKLAITPPPHTHTHRVHTNLQEAGWRQLEMLSVGDKRKGESLRCMYFVNKPHDVARHLITCLSNVGAFVGRRCSTQRKHSKYTESCPTRSTARRTAPTRSTPTKSSRRCWKSKPCPSLSTDMAKGVLPACSRDCWGLCSSLSP